MITAMLQLTGIALILLGLLHAFFPKRFKWAEEFERVSLLNRQIFYVHCLFLVIILIMMGLLSVVYAQQLQEPTPVNRALLGGLTFFWGLRLLIQWFGYSTELWRGNRFNTVVHFVFTGVWSFFTATYLLAFCQVLQAMS